MGDELLKEQQRQTAELLSEVARIVKSTDPRDPGLAMRIDRIERRNQFLFGGNMATLAGVFFMAWKLAQALEGIQ